MIHQSILFVDAGYLFAQAASLLNLPVTRDKLLLDEKACLAALTAAAHQAFPDAPLLRVYWYDAPPRHQPIGSSQLRLAELPGVKLRLGSLNGEGQQKGVDALIQSDMGTLCRNGAASRFLLLSGDEDLRLAVEQAQAFGLRVDLLQVGEGKASVGHALAMEADARHCLSIEACRGFLRRKEHPSSSPAASSASSASSSSRPALPAGSLGGTPPSRAFASAGSSAKPHAKKRPAAKRSGSAAKSAPARSKPPKKAPPPPRSDRGAEPL